MKTYTPLMNNKKTNFKPVFIACAFIAVTVIIIYLVCRHINNNVVKNTKGKMLYTMEREDGHTLYMYDFKSRTNRYISDRESDVLCACFYNEEAVLYVLCDDDEYYLCSYDIEKEETTEYSFDFEEDVIPVSLTASGKHIYLNYECEEVSTVSEIEINDTSVTEKNIIVEADWINEIAATGEYLYYIEDENSIRRTSLEDGKTEKVYEAYAYIESLDVKDDGVLFVSVDDKIAYKYDMSEEKINVVCDALGDDITSCGFIYDEKYILGTENLMYICNGSNYKPVDKIGENAGMYVLDYYE